MKKIVFVICILGMLKSRAQYDTSSIRHVLNYLHTEEFRSSLKKISHTQTEENIRQYKNIRKRANSYRKQQKSHVAFWTSSGHCFITSSNYFIPDTSSRYSRTPADSLNFIRFHKRALNWDYQPPAGSLCTSKIAVDIYFLNNSNLRVQYFRGQNIGMKMGYEEILSFEIDRENKVNLLDIGGIYYN